MSEESEYRMRLVTLGGGGVGKSSIVKRFLFNTYTDRYKPTVEDLFCKEFDLDTMTLKATTSFPPCGGCPIANGHAFLLVYSLDSLASFRHVKQCFEEIREQKADFQSASTALFPRKRQSGDPGGGDHLDLLAGVKVMFVRILRSRTLFVLPNPSGSGNEQVGRASFRLPLDAALY
ncbi:hypothetical protein HPB47_001978 [Ixodes persulcatus]|uniref:Uncharacterized protein n=1 Tax=Ixodes persulcatus TaxID=34615 RepID=A0AC60PP34_IXOPE|nr:hypothetical protein HPB47_001978 [Ixodes persulcatus]